ncbi:MAG: tRNA (adenosine(37)-N6)-threonylcarbamoyltransferase complex ATPase subunit type 1 TsaE [Desulfovibrio sp.]|nr:tRNA (adenosine(37)-N6)-threonylcarbamoyltransferase complex ATPase subunit type 1 TsaE [Desulfovibrio sp.]
MILRLASLGDTARLGALLAGQVLEALAEQGPDAGFALLLQGELGCGKTTLAASFVKALPGGEDAEVSSPSFTLCNVYPTRPQVFHVDLYRAGPGPLPDEAAEALEGRAGSGGAVLVVEWPEYLLPEDMPADAIAAAFDLAFDKQGDACDKIRMLKLEAHGPCAARVLAGLGRALSPEA